MSLPYLTFGVGSISYPGLRPYLFSPLHNPYTEACYISYTEACSSLGLSSLSDRREQLTKHFFDQLKRPDSCLAHLMPLRRDISLTSYLRNARLYELPKA